MFPKFTLLVLLLVSVSSAAQEDAWIYLVDKPNAAASLANPISILTQKAITRKQNHDISIDDRDVPVHEAYISDLKLQDGITALAKSKWFNAVHVRGTEAAISALEALDYVDYIHFANSNLNTVSRSSRSQDKMHIENETIDFTYGDTQNQVEMLSAHNLHSAGFTGEGITVALMDSGFSNVNTMGAFQRLRDQNGLLGGYDFVNRSTAIYESTVSSHGTRVLSTMAAYIQDEFVGTAPDASYYLFRTEDASSENPVEESYWVEAAERADSLGVDMINTSLGYTTYDNATYNYTPADMNGQVAFISKGASIAAEKGILVVVSAGNSGASSWQTVGAPADSPAVLSIGGVDANGSYVFFSSKGGAAQVGYQKPDVVARAGAAYVVDENNNSTQNNGTSFSAPILCGGIASLWQAIPEASPTEIMNYVRQSASQFASPDDFLGFGIPDLDVARSLALSLNDPDFENFRLFPNPVKTELHVAFPASIETLELKLYNAFGQEVLRESLQHDLKSLDVSNLASGLYIAKLSTEKNSKTLKFIKH